MSVLMALVTSGLNSELVLNTGTVLGYNSGSVFVSNDDNNFCTDGSAVLGLC